MAPTIVYIGRYTGNDVDLDYAQAVAGVMQGTAARPTTRHLWGVRFRWRGGKEGVTSASARAALHAINTNVASAVLLGYSGQVTQTVSFNSGTGASGGDWYEADVASVPGGPTNSAIPIPSGTKPINSVLTTGANGTLGMIAAARLENAYDVVLYRKTGLSQPPPNPFGALSTSDPEGQLTLCLICYANEAPLAPINRTPGTTDPNNPSVINEVTPNFAGDHRDLNGAYGASNGGADVGDYMKQYWVYLEEKVGTTWNSRWTFTDDADAFQKAANRFDVDYAGTLTRGNSYRWKCKTRDHFNTWGSESGWLYFNVANQGFVTLAGNPVSTIQSNVPTFDFTWSHQTAQSTNQVKIELYNGDTSVWVSAAISKTVANNATGTLSWADTGLATPFPSGLTWGTTWKYRIQARDTTNNWSDWSDRRQFKTNSAPSIPDSLSPTAGQVVTSRPILYASVLDIDDTAATGLTVKFEIYNNVPTLLQTRTATLLSYDPVTQISIFSYQTTNIDLAAVGTYRFKAYAGDGTLWSGITTVEASATRSAFNTFVYAAGPIVTVQTPTVAQVFANSTPTFAWTCSTQNRYRVRVYEPGTNTVVYERGWITSTSVKQWTIEAGFLRNNHSYEAEIGCEDTTPLQGFSARVAFSTAYTAPATPTSVSAMPNRIGTDPWPTSILVQAGAATGGSLFIGRYIYRDDITDRPLVVLDSPSDVSFIDAHPVSGQQHTYTWRDVYYVDSSHTEKIESAGVSVAAVVELRGSVLSSVIDPVGVRAYLSSVQERSRRLKQDKAKITTWGNSAPKTYYGTGEYWEVPHVVRLLTDDNATATQREQEMETVILSHHTMCYRDERGRKYFVQVDAPEFTDARMFRGDFACVFTEEDYKEGYFVLEPGDLL